jgi:hypothetical protein
MSVVWTWYVLFPDIEICQYYCYMCCFSLVCLLLGIGAFAVWAWHVVCLCLIYVLLVLATFVRLSLISLLFVLACFVFCAYLFVLCACNVCCACWLCLLSNVPGTTGYLLLVLNVPLDMTCVWAEHTTCGPLKLFLCVALQLEPAVCEPFHWD